MILKVIYFMLFSTSLAFEVAIYNSSDYINNNDSVSLVPVLTVNETYRFEFNKDEKLNVDIRLKNKPSDVVASIYITDGEPTQDKTADVQIENMIKCFKGDCYNLKNKKLKTPLITVGIELKNEYYNWSKYQIILQGTSGGKDDSHSDLCLQTSCVMEIDLKNISQGNNNASQTSASPQDNMLVYIASSVVVLGFVLILAIYLIVKKIRRRNPAGTRELNTHSATNEILYADLSFTNGNNNSQTPVHEESPYAQIIGEMRPKT